MRAAAVAMRGVSWLVLALLLLLAAAWGTFHGWIVPRIDELRPRLEMMAGQALGVPVRIGALQARPGGLVPSFELRGVALLDSEGREALRLPRLQAALSVTSLLRLGFDQLYIEAPELDIRRLADGRILVAGLDLGAGAGRDSPAVDWFFSQKEVVVRRGTVRWSDEGRAAPPLALGEVDIVLRNGARRHELRLDATPPSGWGERFLLMGQFRRPLLSRHPGRFADWSGQFYADFARVDVSLLRRHVRLDVEVAEGHGALRLWADLDHGAFVGAAADMALADLSATLGSGLEPLALRSLSGRIGGKRLAGGFQFYTEGLQFQTRDGLRWPGGNLFVSQTAAEGRLPAMGELRADRLNLEVLRQVADRLPLGETARETLRAYPATGLVETLQASWQGPWDAPSKYQARGRVSELTLAARPAPPPPPGHSGPPDLGVPGLRGGAIDFDFNQSGGRARLAIAGGALELPGVFEEPLLPLDRLQAEAQWQIEGERIVVPQASIKLANADAEGEFRGSWQTSDPAKSSSRSRFPGRLDLQGSFSRANGARVHRYLPLGIAEDARHYVRDAVQQGQASGVAVRVRGDLNDIPYADARQGEFRFAGKLRGVTLAYVPRRLQGASEKPWPALTELAGELVIDRNSLRVNGASARVDGLPKLRLSRVEAQIPNLAQDTAVQVTAEASGPAAEMLGVVQGSPLDAMMGGTLAQARAGGDAALRLRLNLPVADLNRSRVQGSVTLAGNDLQVTPDTPLLGRARGVVAFSESGFSLTGAQARVLGGDMRLEGGSRPVPANSGEASVLLRAQGTVSAEGLRQAGELGAIARLAHNASGSTAYSATLAFRRGHPELSVTSSLQGLGLTLPPPLSKSAETALPLRFESALQRDSVAPGATATREQWQLELGRLASLVYVRELSGAQPRVLRGSIAVGLAPGEAAPLPDEGVLANVNLAQLNVDAWEAALAGPPRSGAAAPAAAAQSDLAGPAQAYLPTVLALRARELTVDGRRYRNLVVGGSREGALWRANLDASELSGYVEYRQPAGGSGSRVYARLARLTIAPSAASEVETLLNEPPATMPALDIVVDDFELRGKKLGRVEIEAVNRGAAAAASEWRLNKLNLALPEASLAATGQWVAGAAAAGGRPGARRTTLNFRLDLADAGGLLGRLGMKDVIRGGEGRLEGQVAWTGSPLSLNVPSMNGQFNVNVGRGQFLKADPGIAKLLGVLSLQSLPRRLTLDFRDVFSDGFAFDFIRGDVGIAQGMASTNNLQMKGVNAAVLMDGRADIARETQDIRVVVVPEIDTGTASLVASAINPAVGLGTFLAQLFLRRPLVQAATQEFHIDGTWTDPRVTKVAPKPPAGETKPGNPP
ncbi:YhdP family protein [Ramlibacter sp. 2FC]|uniref:YhdP family protein n=1 Tax=Ramlibacter sp. 2FC TaxID=2502188 RepID=UPI0024C3717F|nr:YhdP family protein [Ramlibacter sp. 2FC]